MSRSIFLIVTLNVYCIEFMIILNKNRNVKCYITVKIELPIVCQNI
jgi:hypothetical protein